MQTRLGFEVLNFKRFEDERGYFQEWYHENGNFVPVQGNKSVSRLNTIRGIHLSKPGINQQKLVSCVTGSILDVVVNLRLHDINFGKYHAIKLNSQESKSIFIESGMGHAFISLEPQTTVVYLTDALYSPDNEIALNPFDAEIGIEWNTTSPIVSKKDLEAMSLVEFKAQFS